MNNPLEVGALARITRDIPTGGGERALREGQLIEIEDYVSAEEAENGTPFYWASTHGTGNINDVVVDADAVEQVKTAAQMNARRIPTVNELRHFLGFALLEEGDEIEITETSIDGESGLEIAGSTHDGLRFAATIQITSIYEADF